MAPGAAISWSGGKDSCAALHRASKSFDMVSMITMFDDDAARSRSHGLRPEVVAAQAELLGLKQIAHQIDVVVIDCHDLSLRHPSGRRR